MDPGAGAFVCGHVGHGAGPSTVRRHSAHARAPTRNHPRQPGRHGTLIPTSAARRCRAAAARQSHAGSRSVSTRGSSVRPIRRGDRGPAVREIRSILTGLELLDDGPAATSSTPPPNAAYGPSSRAAASASTAGSARRPGGPWTPPAGGSAPAPSTTPCPTPLTGDDVRALQERLLEMGYDAGRADGIYGIAHRPGGGPVPARGRADPRRRLRTAHHERAAPARPQGGRRPAAVAARVRRVPPVRPDPRRQDRRHRPRARRQRPRRGGAATGRCAGPRPTSSTTSPAGWRGGSPPPACGCT